MPASDAGRTKIRHRVTTQLLCQDHEVSYAPVWRLFRRTEKSRVSGTEQFALGLFAGQEYGRRAAKDHCIVLPFYLDAMIEAIRIASRRLAILRFLGIGRDWPGELRSIHNSVGFRAAAAIERTQADANPPGTLPAKWRTQGLTATNAIG